MDALVEIVAFVVAIIGVFSSYGWLNRRWKRARTETRERVGLASWLLLAAPFVFVLAGLVALVADRSAERWSRWDGASNELFLAFTAALAAVVWGASTLAAARDLRRSQLHRRAGQDQVWLDLLAEVNALPRLTRDAVVSDFLTVMSLPEVMNDPDVAAAYRQLQKHLAPYPDLSRRFFEWLDPRYEALIESVR